VIGAVATEDSDHLAAVLERLARGSAPVGEDRRELARAGGCDAASLEERLAQFRAAAHLCPVCTLDVDGRPIAARIGLAELWRFYLPACHALGRLAVRPGAVRAIAGVAGPPGSGKSVFCAVLRAVIEATAGAQGGGVAAVSLDGWHRSNAWLEEHGLRGDKGRPATFDVEGFVGALHRLRSESSLGLPRYDRNLHDVVPDGIRIEPRHRLVLVEGNFLLLDRDGWAGVRPCLDLAMFLSMPLEGIEPRIIERHVRGGRSPESARSHFERVDRPNYEACMASAGRAGLIVERAADQSIRVIRPA